MLLNLSKDDAIYYYKIYLKEMKEHIKRLIVDIKDYKKNYIKNEKLVNLNDNLEKLNMYLNLCGFQTINEITKIKDYNDVIDYLEYLLEK